jgi:hypothetical protein
MSDHYNNSEWPKVKWVSTSNDGVHTEGLRLFENASDKEGTPYPPYGSWKVYGENPRFQHTETKEELAIVTPQQELTLRGVLIDLLEGLISKLKGQNTQ